eukprot:scaffold605345_cov17-Prasinocladus_malaysianus.AAC.1
MMSDRSGRSFLHAIRFLLANTCKGGFSGCTSALAPRHFRMLSWVAETTGCRQTGPAGRP